MRLGLFLSAATSCVNAAVLLRPEAPEITAAPIIRVRAPSFTNQHVLGWHSTGKTSGTVLWQVIENSYNLNSILATGSYYHGNCFSSIEMSGTTTCDIDYQLYTECSSGTLLARSTAVPCADEQSACFTDRLYASFGADSPSSQIYCQTKGWEAWDIFIASPPGITPTLTSTATQSSAATTTNTADPSVLPKTANGIPSSTSPSTLETNVPEKKSNTGVIVGGAVGGVALVGLIAGGIFAFLFMKRRKKSEEEKAMIPTMTGGSDYKLDQYQHVAEPQPQHNEVPELMGDSAWESRAAPTPARYELGS